MSTALVMESDYDYKLERWIALFLFLLFFLPFVAKAEEAPVPVATPVTVSFNGVDSTLDYRCDEEDADGLVECMLELDGRPIARRVAFAGERLKVLVSFSGDMDGDGRLDLVVDVARNRFQYKPAIYLSSAPAPLVRVADASHSSRSKP
jgi:hypothetical protein